MNKIIKDFKNITYGLAPEESKDVFDWIEKLPSQNYNFINGKWIKPTNKKTINCINPSNNQKLYKLSVSSELEVDKAVKSADKAFLKWSKISPYKRSKFLYALARLIQKHARFLSVLESIDNGKPLRETRDIDIPLVIRHFYYHAG